MQRFSSRFWRSTSSGTQVLFEPEYEHCLLSLCRKNCLTRQSRGTAQKRAAPHFYVMPRKAKSMIKQVGNTVIQLKHKALCHCGAVVLELDLPNGIENPRRCDCSICRRKGAIVASVKLSGINIIKGTDALRLYQFNTMTAKHYFCSVCGIYTHHQRRSNPEEYGYNVGCLEGVNPFLIENIPTNDGINHPADRNKT